MSLYLLYQFIRNDKKMLTFYIQNINVEVTENPKDNKSVCVV